MRFTVLCTHWMFPSTYPLVASMRSIDAVVREPVPAPKTSGTPERAHWQLYTASMACGRAAASLTAAVVRAAKMIDQMASKGYRPTEQGAQKIYQDVIYPVMSRNANFGAYDTEPRGVAYDALDRIVSVVTGDRVRYSF